MLSPQQMENSFFMLLPADEIVTSVSVSAVCMN